MENITLSDIKFRMESDTRTRAARNVLYTSGNTKVLEGNLDEVTETEYVELWYCHDHYYTYIENLNQFRPHEQRDMALREIKKLNPSYVTPSEYARPTMCPMDGAGLSFREASLIMRMDFETNLEMHVFMDMQNNLKIIEDYIKSMCRTFNYSDMKIAVSNNNITELELAYLVVPEHVHLATVKFEKSFTMLEAKYRVKLLNECDLQRTKILTQYYSENKTKETTSVSGIVMASSKNYVLLN